MTGALGLIVAIVGAESTGKTTLAVDLAQALRERGWRAVFVAEALREFCEVQGRTPRPHEQAEIAQLQTKRIAQAAAVHEVVLADTTALMTAVYSDLLFEDASLYPQALLDHAQAGLTLLTALDLPWIPDGLQRDGAHVQAPVDERVRSALAQAQLPYAVVAGQGAARLAQALAAVEHVLAADEGERLAAAPRWQWLCEQCDDGPCERLAASALTAVSRAPGRGRPRR